MDQLALPISSRPRTAEPGSNPSHNAAPGDRYTLEVRALLNDAVEHSSVHVFADALAKALALIAFGSGPVAAGDILIKLGDYLRYFAQQSQAIEEAERAQLEGRKPQ